MSTTTIVALRKRGNQIKRGWPVKASTKILANQLLDVSTGYARPWPSTAALGLVPGGMAIESQDNTSGANGDIWVEAEVGEVLFPLGSFVVANVGGLAFGVDEANAAPTNSAGTLSPIGRVTEVVLASDSRVALGERSGAWIDLNVPGVHLSPIKITKTIAEADLTAAALSEALAIGGVLPSGARLVGWSLGEGTLTLFSGGGASAATVKLGTAGDDDAICTATSIVTGQTGFPKTGTAGVLGFRGAPLGGEQIKATFTSDVNVATLTAGSLVINVFVDFPGS